MASKKQIRKQKQQTKYAKKQAKKQTKWQRLKRDIIVAWIISPLPP